MKVMVISIVIGALGTVAKGLIKKLEDLEISGRVETIQTIGQNTEGICAPSDSSGKNIS